MFRYDVHNVLMAMKFGFTVTLPLIGSTESITGRPYDLSWDNRWIVKVVAIDGKPRVCEFEESYSL